MKSRLYLPLVAMLAALVGCVNDIVEVPAPDGQRTITVNLLPNEQTRTTFAGGTLRWNAADTVVYFTSKKNEGNEDEPSLTGTSAPIMSGSKFTATVESGDDRIYVVYPHGANLGRVYTDRSTRISPSQIQNEMGVFNGANLPMGGNAAVPSNGEVNMEYEVFGAIVRFDLKASVARTATDDDNKETLEAIVLVADEKTELVSHTTNSVVVVTADRPVIAGNVAEGSTYTIGSVYAVVNYVTTFHKPLRLKVYTSKGVYECATDLTTKTSVATTKRFDRYHEYVYSWNIDNDTNPKSKSVKIAIDYTNDNDYVAWDGNSSTLDDILLTAYESAPNDIHTLKIKTEGGGTVNIQTVMQISAAMRKLPATAKIAVDMSEAEYAGSSFDHAFCPDMSSQVGTPQLVEFIFPADHRGASITSLDYTFRGCTGLTDVSSMVLPVNTTSMWGTFECCTNLKTPPAVIPTLVMKVRSLFFRCTSLESAPIIPANVSNMRMTFYECKKLAGTLRIMASISALDYSKGAADISGEKLWLYDTFKDVNTSNIDLILDSSQTGNIGNNNQWGNLSWKSIETCNAIYRLGGGEWKALTTTAGSAFETDIAACTTEGNYSLEIVGRTDAIADIKAVGTAIDACPTGALFEIDLSNLRYGGTSLANVFAGNDNLGNDNLKTFKFPRCASLTDLSGAFLNCTELTAIDYSASMGIALPLTNMNNTFKGCAKLSDIPSFVPSSVTQMANCFEGCALITGPVIIQAAARDIRGAFSGCTELTNVEILSNAATIDAATTNDAAVNLTTNTLYINNIFGGSAPTGVNLTVATALRGDAAENVNKWQGMTFNSVATK